MDESEFIIFASQMTTPEIKKNIIKLYVSICERTLNAVEQGPPAVLEELQHSREAIDFLTAIFSNAVMHLPEDEISQALTEPNPAGAEIDELDALLMQCKVETKV